MGLAAKILIVDEDAEFRQSFGKLLGLHDDYRISEAGTGAAALGMVKNTQFDAIFLDVLLPDTDGREVCRRLRRNGVTVPIIMLTVADTDADMILGLNAGADDYIAKPMRIGVVLARLRAQLRAHTQSETAVFSVGPYTFYPARKLLVESQFGRRVLLTERESGVLKYLLQRRGHQVPRQELMQQVWKYKSDVNTHTLETHVYRLRQKIERDPEAPEILITGRNGYQVVG